MKYDDIANINPGDWSTLLWVVTLMLIIQLVMPLVQVISTMINKKISTNSEQVLLQEVKKLVELLITKFDNIIKSINIDENNLLKVLNKVLTRLNDDMLIFFYRRYTENGIGTNQSLILNNYKLFSSVLHDRYINEIRQTCDDENLFEYFDDGIFNYISNMMLELFNYQVTLYNNSSKPDCNKLESVLSINRNKIIDNFYDYQNKISKKTLKEIIDSLSKIE